MSDSESLVVVTFGRQLDLLQTYVDYLARSNMQYLFQRRPELRFAYTFSRSSPVMVDLQIKVPGADQISALDDGGRGLDRWSLNFVQLNAEEQCISRRPIYFRSHFNILPHRPRTYPGRIFSNASHVTCLLRPARSGYLLLFSDCQCSYTLVFCVCGAL